MISRPPIVLLDACVLYPAALRDLLMRLAVAQHGVHERLAAPLWLEHACMVWWSVRAEPAQLDALKQQPEARVVNCSPSHTYMHACTCVRCQCGVRDQVP
mgnify:CR=1 FL=1